MRDWEAHVRQQLGDLALEDGERRAVVAETWRASRRYFRGIAQARPAGRSCRRACAFASTGLAIAAAENSERANEGGRYDGPSQASVAARVFDVVSFDDVADADSIYWTQALGGEPSRLAGDGSHGSDLRAMAALSGSDRSDGSVLFHPSGGVATPRVCLDFFSSVAVFRIFHCGVSRVRDSRRSRCAQCGAQRLVGRIGRVGGVACDGSARRCISGADFEIAARGFRVTILLKEGRRPSRLRVNMLRPYRGSGPRFSAASLF